MTHEQEFERVRREIYDEGLGKVFVYKDRAGFKGVEHGCAYVDLVESPPYNILLTKLNKSWKKLMLDLAHEYGHVIDYVRYVDTKRWKLMDDTIKLRQYPKSTMQYKKAVIKNEYMAESYVPKFLKKFNVSIPYTSQELDEGLYVMVLIVKYELMYGKHPSSSLKKQWKHRFSCKTPKINTSWVYDLSTLLEH